MCRDGSLFCSSGNGGNAGHILDKIKQYNFGDGGLNSLEMVSGNGGIGGNINCYGDGKTCVSGNGGNAGHIRSFFRQENLAVGNR